MAECKTCRKIQNIGLQDFKVSVEKEIAPTVKKNKSAAVDEFLKAMNAVMNEGGGVVLVHVSQAHELNLFEEQIDGKLLKLIPDDTFFHDNFERHFVNSNHVAFRVKAKRRRLSTLNFNSKVSLNKGLDDPTHSQMFSFVSEKCFPQEPIQMSDNASPLARAIQQDDHKESIIFKHNSEVMTKTDKGSVSFQESVRSQAKSVSETDSKDIQSLKDYCWTKAVKYIPAFSKLPGGGSVIFGLNEKRNEGDKKWEEVDQTIVKDIFQIHKNNKNWRIWKDNNSESKVYYVAEESSVPLKSQTRTGKFECVGLCLSESDRTELKQFLQEKASTKLLWHPSDQCNGNVDVEFPRVVGTSDRCVAKVVIQYFNGLSFDDTEGPESYKLINGNTIRISFKEWIDLMKEACLKQEVSR